MTVILPNLASLIITIWVVKKTKLFLANSNCWFLNEPFLIRGAFKKFPDFFCTGI